VSRVGKNPIKLPRGVKVKIGDESVTVEGRLGELSQKLQSGISVTVEGSEVVVTRSDDSGDQKALHGLMRSLINNMVIGVTEGFSKRLVMYGTGYRATQKGKGLELLAGYSHPVEVEPIGNNVLGVEGNTTITVTGPDKQVVGQQAASIRAVRKPSRFQSKAGRIPLFGIAYEGEQLRLRVGKTVAGVGA
jgi:large subunit ribosomal protein L6